jgi:hypothetical protein
LPLNEALERTGSLELVLDDLKEIALTIIFAGICLRVSLVFWNSNKALKLTERILVSAHGVVIFLIFAVAFLVNYFGFSSFDYGNAYQAFLTLPIISMIFSVFRHQGKKHMLLLHLYMLPLLIFTWVFGGMYVTGDSL